MRASLSFPAYIAGKGGLVTEHATEVVEQGGWGIELTPGHPDNPPASDLQAAVALTVGLEGRAGPVRSASIQFDDQAVLPPQAISLDFESVQVEDGV
jgi:hypothetical protein